MQKVKEIRKRLRLAMDGTRSTTMREKGICYKLNFGVPLMTLREWGKEYFPDKELAEELWKEDVRELKILATLIYPPEEFTSLQEWVNGIDNPELAEQASMNLFSKTENAETYAAACLSSEELYTQLCGYLIYSRLFILGYSLGEDKESYFHRVFEALNDPSLILRNAAFNSLKKLSRQSVFQAKEVLLRFKQNESAFQSHIDKDALYEELFF